MPVATAVIASAITLLAAAVVALAMMNRAANLLRDINKQLTIIETAAKGFNQYAQEVARNTDVLVDIARLKGASERTESPPEAESDLAPEDITEKYQHLALAVADIITAEYQAPATYTEAAALGYKDGVKEVVNRLRRALKDA